LGAEFFFFLGRVEVGLDEAAVEYMEQAMANMKGAHCKDGKVLKVLKLRRSLSGLGVLKVDCGI
jgi:hypothetical protein